MKRLAVAAALVAVFAIPALASGLGLAETVPQGTVAVECSEWVFDSSPTDTGRKPLVTVNIPPAGKVSNRDIVMALQDVESAVSMLQTTVWATDYPAVQSMTCVEWQEFVVR